MPLSLVIDLILMCNRLIRIVLSIGPLSHYSFCLVWVHNEVCLGGMCFTQDSLILFSLAFRNTVSKKEKVSHYTDCNNVEYDE